jgi:hypothetical protein
MWEHGFVTVSYFTDVCGTVGTSTLVLYLCASEAYPSETPFWKFAFLVLSFKIRLKLKWTVETGPLVYIYDTKILNTVNAPVQLKD